MAHTTYQIRLDENEKKETFAILQELGITPAQAIKLFFAQVRHTHSIPFPINKPNAETIQAIEEAINGEDLIVCQDADDLFNKLGI